MLNESHEEITEEKYFDSLEVLPPLYINEIDGKKISAFAISEAYDFGPNSVVLSVCYKMNTKFYSFLAEVKNSQNEPIEDTYNYHFTYNNKAFTYNPKKKTNGNND